jgi:hypothetical protein
MVVRRAIVLNISYIVGCYNVKEIPEDDWYCQRCENKKRKKATVSYIMKGSTVKIHFY